MRVGTAVCLSQRQEFKDVGGTDCMDMRFEVYAPTILMRSYFSIHQLWAAELAAAQALSFEQNVTGEVPAFSIEQRAYVMNAVFLSVAFLESAINEILQDIVDGEQAYTGPVNPVVRRCIAVWWGQSEGQGRATGSILDKYQALLEFYGVARMKKGLPPYQDADLIIQLRNTLMHYKPQYYGGDKEHRLVGKLRTKFEANPLMRGSGNSYFPDHCLGGPCARWAVKTVKAFADAYFPMLHITATYARPHSWPTPDEVIARSNNPTP
jgi:hypothetical protein